MPKDDLDVRALLDRLLAMFEGSALVPAGLEPEAAAFLEHAREAFLSAGAERLERSLNHCWTQLGLAVSGENVVPLLVALGPTLRALHGGKEIDRFFFMFKPPGLRLRVRGADVRRGIVPTIETAIAHLGLPAVQSGAYDAEVFQFGGETGIDIAHEHFTYDSIAVFEYLDLPEAERTTDRLIVSVLMVNDLFRRVTDDAFEHWDLWANMALARRRPTPAQIERYALEARFHAEGDLYDAILAEPGALLDALSEGERRVVERAFVHNATIAQRLREASRTDHLLFGIRQIVPFFAIFDWNRWSIPPGDQYAACYVMERLSSPKNPR